MVSFYWLFLRRLLLTVQILHLFHEVEVLTSYTKAIDHIFLTSTGSLALVFIILYSIFLIYSMKKRVLDCPSEETKVAECPS